MNEITLERLLRMQVESQGVKVSPEFRLAVQRITDSEVTIIIHPNGHNGETLDYSVRGNTLTPLN